MIAVLDLRVGLIPPSAFQRFTFHSSCPLVRGPFVALQHFTFFLCPLLIAHFCFLFSKFQLSESQRFRIFGFYFSLSTFQCFRVLGFQFFLVRTSCRSIRRRISVWPAIY